MKAFFRLLVCALALAVPAWVSAVAQQTPAPTPSGHVLVLENEHVLEGEVTRDGAVYHIRRDSSELTVPAAKALAVCASMEEAYKFVCSRANLRDADEHLRLARWCLINELRDLAIVEASTAVAMRPGHAESRQLLAMLQRPAVVSPPVPALPPQSVAAPEPVLPVSADCLAFFTTRVQPILMNTCASCHATGRGGSFNMVRISEAAARKSTQQNLTAVIKKICFDQPGASPLLFNASFAHGGAHAAPLSVQGPGGPLEALRDWVNVVVAQHPHLRIYSAKAVAGQTPSSGFETAALKTGKNPPATFHDLQHTEANTADVSPPVARIVEHNPDVVAATKGAPGPGEVRQQGPVQAMPALPVDDYYSADVFNQQWHPGRR
jgi:hypothetical protein